MSLAIRNFFEDTNAGRRAPTPVVESPLWNSRKLLLGLKGWVVFYVLWACIFHQTRFDPAQHVAAPEAVSHVRLS